MDRRRHPSAPRLLLTLVATASALLVLTSLVAGAPPPMQIRVNGRVVPFDPPAVEKDGQIMAPAQAVCDALGALLNYDDFTHTVKVFKGSRLVLMRVGDPRATVNLKTHRLTVAPYLDPGGVMIPLRFLAEGLGGVVQHDSEHGMLDIRIAETEPVQIPHIPIPGRTTIPLPRPSSSPELPSRPPGPSPRASGSPAPRPSASPGAKPAPSGAPTTAPGPAPVIITEFNHSATAPLHSGDLLHVTLLGTPGGRAAFFIEGLAEDLPLTEVTTGRYAGDYRIPDDVRLKGARVYGTLQVGGEKAPLVTSPVLVTVEALRARLERPEPAAGSTIKTRTPRIAAFFEAQGGTVVVRGVKVKVNGVDVTAKAYITRQFFTYTPETPLAVGRVRVDVEAEIEHRTLLRDGWEFEVR